MNTQELEKWGQEANKEYAGIVRKMNKGRGLLWNVFQTSDIFMDCDVLFVGLNPRNGTNMDDVAICQENGEIKEKRVKDYASDFTHIRGILGGQWISQKALADNFDGFQTGTNSEVYKDFFGWKILKGLRFGDPNSFFTNVVRRGSWNLINYYPFGTNDMNDLNAELARLPKDDIQTIRRLNLELYDILNPKLIVFLGINTLKTVISNGSSSGGSCHKESSMYVREIANAAGTIKRAAISISHTSRHWLTDEENQRIAGMLGIEVGHLNISIKNELNTRTIKECVVNQLKQKNYKFTEDNNSTTRFKFGKTLELTVTSTGNGYMALRHINYKGDKVTDYNYKENGIDKQEIDDIRNVLSRHAFRFNFDVWLGTKSFSAYRCSTEDEVIKALLLEIEALEKELYKY